MGRREPRVVTYQKPVGSGRAAEDETPRTEQKGANHGPSEQESGGQQRGSETSRTTG